MSCSTKNTGYLTRSSRIFNCFIGLCCTLFNTGDVLYSKAARQWPLVFVEQLMLIHKTMSCSTKNTGCWSNHHVVNASIVTRFHLNQGSLVFVEQLMFIQTLMSCSTKNTDLSEKSSKYLVTPWLISIYYDMSCFFLYSLFQRHCNVGDLWFLWNSSCLYHFHMSCSTKNTGLSEYIFWIFQHQNV